MKTKIPVETASPASSCTTFSSSNSSKLNLFLPKLRSSPHVGPFAPCLPLLLCFFQLSAQSLFLRELILLTGALFQAHEHSELLFTLFDYCLISPQMYEPPKDRFCLYYLLYLHHGAHFLAGGRYFIRVCSDDKLRTWLYLSSS